LALVVGVTDGVTVTVDVIVGVIVGVGVRVGVGVGDVLIPLFKQMVSGTSESDGLHSTQESKS